ncbi:MAG TPA: hypothetical protein VF260_06275 [Bacilli bacterium]
MGKWWGCAAILFAALLFAVYQPVSAVAVAPVSGVQSHGHAGQSGDDKYEKGDKLEKDDDCRHHVKLTKEQVSKLNAQYDQLYRSKKELIETHYQYGLISAERKEHALEMLKKHIDHRKSRLAKMAAGMQQ